MEARNLKAIEKKYQPEIKKSKLSNDEKIEIAGRVSRIVSIMLNTSLRLPFPLFSKTWRDYPKFLNEAMVLKLQARSSEAGIVSPDDFMEAARLGIRHGLLVKESSDTSHGGAGFDVLVCSADYPSRVATFVIGGKDDKVVAINIVNRQRDDGFRSDFNFS